MPDIASFQEKLGVRFLYPALLERALVHSSFVNENPAFGAGHNERLEFLGDAVLGLIVAEKVYSEYPDVNEGEMTKIRAALVNRETLARVAGTINLGDFLFLGKGEESSGGRNKTVNLACAMEAVIAAVYLDRGAEIARDVVLRLLAEQWTKLVEQGIDSDFKSQLQEVVQSRFQVTPAYRLVNESGPDHDKTFNIEVLAGDRVLGIGSGKSKKAAEMEAAWRALDALDKGFTK